MQGNDVDFAVEKPQPCDEWHNILTAADSAGRWAARQLACRCSLSALSRGGTVHLQLEPLDSSVVTWLHHHEYGTIASGCLLMPVTVSPVALHPALQAQAKSASLLVRHAYATAFSTVLAEQAGAVAEIRFPDEQVSAPQHSLSPRTATTRSPEADLPDCAATDENVEA
ncbi:hypothetical protein [Salinifilum ghardaiensis]